MQSGRNITYTYDALYRLTNAATTGSGDFPAWGLSEAYDRYGNRSAQSISSGCSGITCPTNSVSVSATTNHITGSPYLYDASGNMTDDGSNTITYDGEGHAVTASGGLGSGTYTYDGNGLRVKKVAGSTTTVYIFSGSKVVAEYANGAAPSSPTVEYIYGGSALLAKINSSGTFYYHQDHLSNRMVTNSSGGVYTFMGHFPFGESWYNGTNDKLYFTTYEYDAESGNHYAMARYHVSRLGRLSSPDPLAGSTADPQSLNRYSYSINDPSNVTDPSGALAGCSTAQAKPKDKSQQASGGGHSDTDALDSGTDANDANADPPPQNGCVSHANPFGGGGADLDGGYAGDDSGDLPSGAFLPGQSTPGGIDPASQIALENVPVYGLVADWGQVGHYEVSGGNTGCTSGAAICLVSVGVPEYGVTGYEEVQVGSGLDLLGLTGPQQSGPISNPGPSSQKRQPQSQANNKPGFWSCTFSAGTGTALGTTALDAIGIIPGGGNVLHGVQLAAGVGALGLSLGRASFSEAAVGGATTGLAFADAAGETANIAVHGVEIVPVLGNIVSAGATVNDIFGKEGVISSYKACLSGGH
ncbi:MAG: RHS repeat-associated core domain-containing protein [Candidatus Acidiferrales bacterium]